MADAVLVLNAGSSSLKFSAFRADADDPHPLVRGRVAGIGLGGGPTFTLSGSADESLPGETTHEQAVEHVLPRLTAALGGARVVAVGHRVVHGGTAYSEPVVVTPAVLADLDGLVPLAPLHQPHNVAAIRAATRALPDARQVACFDTAFHRTQPPVARLFGLPRELSEAGVVRYGFHGLSYEFVAAELPALDPTAAGGRTVVAHLGNGASLCGLLGGKSVATTMSFTPADGLLMATRAGSLDPGAVLYLLRRGMSVDAVEDLLYHRSGLLGVSGVSADMRELIGPERLREGTDTRLQASGDPRAAEAVDLFVYRVGRELGSLAAALGGLDALVFTGGIGENSAEIRARIVASAGWLGAELDPAANASGGPRLSPPGSRVSVWVLPTDEERTIARHTRRVSGEG